MAATEKENEAQHDHAIEKATTVTGLPFQMFVELLFKGIRIFIESNLFVWL